MSNLIYQLLLIYIVLSILWYMISNYQHGFPSFLYFPTFTVPEEEWEETKEMFIVCGRVRTSLNTHLLLAEMLVFAAIALWPLQGNAWRVRVNQNKHQAKLFSLLYTFYWKACECFSRLKICFKMEIKLGIVKVSF